MEVLLGKEVLDIETSVPVVAARADSGVVTDWVGLGASRHLFLEDTVRGTGAALPAY